MGQPERERGVLLLEAFKADYFDGFDDEEEMSMGHELYEDTQWLQRMHDYIEETPGPRR